MIVSQALLKSYPASEGNCLTGGDAVSESRINFSGVSIKLVTLEIFSGVSPDVNFGSGPFGLNRQLKVHVNILGLDVVPQIL